MTLFTKKRISLILIMLIAFIDLVGIGLVYPMFASMLFQGDGHLLPADASDTMRGTCLGILLAAMPITQFFASPILGMLSDQKGRRKILIPCLLIGVLGYLMALAAVSMENLALLMLSRVAIGISAGSATVVGAAIADISSTDDKAKNFGLLNMSLGLGFTVGPFLGGILSSASFLFIEGYELPFAVAGFMTLINLVLVLFLFEDAYVPKLGGKLSFTLGIQNIQKAFLIKELRILFITVFLCCVGWSFYWEFAPVTWISEHDFDTATIGNFYAYGALVYAFSCGVLIRPITNKFSNQNVLFFSLILCGLSIGMLVFHSSALWLWLYIPLQQFAIALFWPTSAAIVSNSVSEDIQGETLGVLQSMDSLAFAVSPLIAGPLLGITTAMPSVIGGTFMFLAAAVLIPVLKKSKLASKASSATH